MVMAEPEHLIRKIVRACGACEDCRSFIEESCLFLSELFRLNDRIRDSGEEPWPEELRRLTALCNLCGLCPCANIRSEIIQAKAAYAKRHGLSLGVRLLQDVGRAGKMCGAFPRLTNIALRGPLVPLTKRTLGIHPDRSLPALPLRSFDAWMEERAGVGRKTIPGRRRVAYFPGCTARHFFPEVARSAVEVLEAFGADVIVPQGVCCGMPPLLEGDRAMVLDLASRNLKRMADLVRDGMDLVCSCPTCGYVFKHLLPEGAYYSEEYQRQAGADSRTLRIPAGKGINGPREGNMVVLSRAIYGAILKDKGLFSGLDPLSRIAVGEGTFDLGEYLGLLTGEGGSPEMAYAVPGRMLYYPPCHLREQKIGLPFPNLLGRVPGLCVEALAGSLNCCGMAGIMGFKKNAHADSLRIGAPLMEKIRAHRPEAIVTECLSCRLQFQHMDTIPVHHPVEVLRTAILGCPTLRSGERPSR
jgi:glycerol-3-phosphate dehydrogenase subunit C